ncbi:2'-5' RNA ligase family protein [Nocardia sp. CC227C]|uniref:2'-5' RNA ligase family protein n=1 Tax=Nocardia sp. CC227C TaxID=3044562 RepID=UPI00278C123F|nr:2'-5' RNA ligase family protein [Nocardia sp. CC227C]
MVQSVELILDEAAESTIRDQWRLLAEAGLHSPDANHRPHITVAVAREIWPRLDKSLAREPFTAIPVLLGGLLVFGARRPILVRAVVPSLPLLDLQRRLFGVISPCPGIPSTVRPDAWTPHVTLARRVTPTQLPTALAAVGRDGDFPATVVGIRRWDGDRRREWPVG